MPLFNNIINKLSKVNLSDINHELGKAKENIVNETGNYLGSSHVGNLIRSESTKFGNIFGAKPRDSPSLPKSTSLPVIQGLSPEHRPRNGSSCARHLGSKYKYRSSYCDQEEESEGPLSPVPLMDEDSIINRFIKVVGSEENSSPQSKNVATSPIVRSTSLSSREDIRKKLASFGEEETIPEEEDEEPGKNNNLEICFINETASDEEGEVMVNPLEPLSDEEDVSSLQSISNQNFVHLSKSNGDRFKSDINFENAEDEEFEEKKHNIQATAKVALSQCKQVAKRQLAVEKQKRINDDPLKKLLGVSSIDINQDLLSGYNINILQVILNDFREKIEQHNTELVNLLIQKDELETEQDSMLIDIEDISHSSLM